MATELHCPSCGKIIKASRKDAGTMSKCPNCENEVYIPTPEDEIEELPLAPEDATDRQREATLQRERRELERMLSREDEGRGKTASGSEQLRGESGPERKITIGEVIVTYLSAMRDSNLARADQAMAVLLKYREESKKLVDRLITDQIPPKALGDIPAAVYHGFLKNLRSQL